MNDGIKVVNGGVHPQREEPTYEESVRFQARIIGLWEQQQQVLGYTKATIALNLRNLNEKDYLIPQDANINRVFLHF